MKQKTDNVLTAIVKQVELEAKIALADSSGSHDWDHTERVRNSCVHIGMIEGANLDILALAALLHDIARREQDQSKGRICHAERGAEKARELLRRHDIDIQTIEAVAHCIETHRLKADKFPTTIEAKVLFDADTLDGIGAIGLGRQFAFAALIGARLHNRDVDMENGSWEYSRDDTPYRYFLARQQDIVNRMMTSEGKRLAEGRYNFMLEFFDRINKEVSGDL
ncbi:MAG: HD domain-containing protein [Patescibacteria group bacterium]